MKTPYDRALASLSRRAFLDAAWKLGAGAALVAAGGRDAIARPLFRD